jgi:signal transduction histidine kinase
MMRSARRLLTPPGWLRLPCRTARLRLTMLYGGLFTVAGAGLLTITFWLFERTTAGTVIASGKHFGQGIRRLACKGPRIGQPRPGLLRPAHVPRICDQLLNLQFLALNRVHAIDLHTLLIQSAIALAVMAALAIALGWLVAGRVLRPLRVITATARRISATSLHERLALAGPDDEFTELAGTLNELLGRLEASFTAQRHFAVNASHELRTPLTLDRTLLQVALRDSAATVEQWRSTGQEVLDSGRQQERLLEALLALASSEAGRTHREPVDLPELTMAALRVASTEIERRRIQVETSISPAPLLGDPDLIGRLVANLLDNAVQHNIPGGTIEFSTGQPDDRAVLSVANSGPVIPPAEVDRLFRPFQRLASARTSNGGGHGLGLSIVRAIATAHGADVTARARPEGGLQIEVSFPAG